MDKFEGVSRADVLSIDYSCEMVAQPRQIEKIVAGMGMGGMARSSRKPKSKSRPVFAVARYVFCTLLLGICLLGKFTSSEAFTTAGSFIKDELSKDATSELVVGLFDNG
ncbi:MAG: hypothetical protein FWE84_04040 [Firmicutes bacterium]|nr:hypothetical protein [Bacillota bacterium]